MKKTPPQFSTIPDAIEDIRQGRMVVVVEGGSDVVVGSSAGADVVVVGSVDGEVAGAVVDEVACSAPAEPETTWTSPPGEQAAATTTPESNRTVSQERTSVSSALSRPVGGLRGRSVRMMSG